MQEICQNYPSFVEYFVQYYIMVVWANAGLLSTARGVITEVRGNRFGIRHNVLTLHVLNDS